MVRWLNLQYAFLKVHINSSNYHACATIFFVTKPEVSSPTALEFPLALWVSSNDAFIVVTPTCTVTGDHVVLLTVTEPEKHVIGGDVWFRFKEGYTNAVRKNVRVQDLIWVPPEVTQIATSFDYIKNCVYWSCSCCLLCWQLDAVIVLPSGCRCWTTEC